VTRFDLHDRRCTVRSWRSVQKWLLALCCVFFVIYIGWVHWIVINTPAQLEFAEGAALKQVQGIMAGIPIYRAEAQPEYFSIYGIGYPLFHTAVSQLMGNSLRTGRLASAALIALSSLLLLAIMRRKTSSIIAVALTTFFYAACTYWETPLDKPDALGLLTYIAGIALIEMLGPAWPTLLGVTVVSLLAFLIKPYFIVIGPVAISYVFFRHSRTIGLLFTGVWLAALAMLLVVINATMPFYLTDAVTAQSVAASAPITLESTQYMLRQTVAFFVFIAGPVWLVLIGSAARLTESPAWESLGWRWSFGAYGSIVIGLILVGKMGHNQGNWLVYFFHLLLPFFLIWLAEQAPKLDDLPLAISGLAILGICASAAFTSYHGLWSMRELRQIRAAWDEIDRVIQPHDRVLGSPAITGLLVAQGREVFDSGLTGYFPLANEPGALRLGNLTEPRAKVSEIWSRYCGHLRSLIVNRYFDIIVQSPIDGYNNPEPSCWRDIPLKYHMSAELQFPVPWVKRLKIWLPRTAR
jgi:hypothetical protein